VSEEFLGGGNFGGAICRWAAAPPTIALVAKSWGSLRASPAGEEPAVAGRFNHAPGRDREARAEPTCYKVLPFCGTR
jgi:hypothetical protein